MCASQFDHATVPGSCCLLGCVKDTNAGALLAVNKMSRSGILCYKSLSVLTEVNTSVSSCVTGTQFLLSGSACSSITLQIEEGGGREKKKK